MLAGSIVTVDLAAEGLLTDTPSDVASKRLRMLHIQLNLPENWPRLDVTRSKVRDRKRGSTHVVLF